VHNFDINPPEKELNEGLALAPIVPTTEPFDTREASPASPVLWTDDSLEFRVAVYGLPSCFALWTAQFCLLVFHLASQVLLSPLVDLTSQV